MRALISRRKVVNGGIFVEEINLITGLCVCKLFRKNKKSKFFVAATVGYSS